LSDIFTEEDAHLFADVTTLNLQSNNLRELPECLPLVLPNLQLINLNNNPLEEVLAVADVLAGCTQLKSLFIALSVEEEVDYVLKKLPRLEYLNGLAIDREEIEGAGIGATEGRDDSSEEEVVASAHKGHSLEQKQKEEQKGEDEY
jgi:hypothetical protein